MLYPIVHQTVAIKIVIQAYGCSFSQFKGAILSVFKTLLMYPPFPVNNHLKIADTAVTETA